VGRNLWFELRAFVKCAVRESELHALDANAFALLEWVVDQTQTQKDPIYMQQLVMESKVASPATTLKCVGLLEDADLVSVRTDPKDARRRIIRPTRHALEAMDALGEKTEAWLSTSGSTGLRGNTS